MLERLVKGAKELGVTQIQLEAADMGNLCISHMVLPN